MPDDAPKAKVAATRGYGAEIVFYDRLKQDREAVAIEIAERDGRVMVPPYDDYLILAVDDRLAPAESGRRRPSRSASRAGSA